MIPTHLAVSVAVALASSSLAAHTEGPVELGRVRFETDFDKARSRAQAESKPILLVFQEVPGCETCRSFGRGPLSLPGCVEAIETVFVPVVCRNNVPGAERALLERFDEPSWNNPVVRFLDASGRDVAPRADRAWSEGAFLESAVAALAKSGAKAPAWLADLATELSDRERERVVISMHCFWEGQAHLGRLDGVVDVRAGHANGDEVCEVTFAPERTTLARVLEGASRAGVLERVLVRDSKERARVEAVLAGNASQLAGDVRAAAESDDLRALKRDRAAWLLPLTRAQRVRANAALASGRALEARDLTPRLFELRRSIESALAASATALGALEPPRGARELGPYEDRLRASLARR